MEMACALKDLTPCKHDQRLQLLTNSNCFKGALNIMKCNDGDGPTYNLHDDAVRIHSPKAVTTNNLVSIIILCCNEMPYTLRCIESIFEHTHHPHELIFVDNGSSDGTTEYLHKLQKLAGLHYDEVSRHENTNDGTLKSVKVIRNETNQGFPKGCNQGIKVATGEFVLLLNNDVVVTEGWLSRMVHLAQSNTTIGMVGPRSNYVDGKQQITVDYGDIDKMHQFAVQLANDQDHNWFALNDNERLVGFCLLIKSKVLESIGLLDEQFGLGLYDDDDISMRARFAGYELVVAMDVFIHHFGSRTFASLEIDMPQLAHENHVKLMAKWEQQNGAPSMAIGAAEKRWQEQGRERTEVAELLERAGFRDEAYKLMNHTDRSLIPDLQSKVATVRGHEMFLDPKDSLGLSCLGIEMTCCTLIR